MKKIISNYSVLFLFLALAFFNKHIDAQTCPICPSNLSFENGDFSNWTGTYGNYQFALPTPTTSPNFSYVPAGSGFPSTRYAITSGTGTDPNITNASLPVVAPCGGTYSARIGCTCAPESQGAGNWPYYESITYTLNVTAQTAGFTYMYAAVLENGSHDQFTQPQFEVIMTKCSDGTLLPCGQYSIYAGNGSSQFLAGPGKFQYTNWTSVSTDLTNYIGQQVCITFRVRDCMGNLSSTNGSYSSASGGGHRGYAYIDTYCTPIQFSNPEFCAGASSIQVCAPAGYKSYTWPAGQPGISGSPTTQCVTINNPVSGTTYTVNMTSNGGCPVTMKVPIKGIPVTKSSDTTIVCPGVSSTLTVSATGTNGPYTYNWSNGLGTGTSATVSPTVSTTYTVTVKNANGCTSNELFYVIMKPCGPVVTATGSTICVGGTGSLTATGSGGTSPYTYSWSPNTNLSSTTGSSITASPPTTTTYTVTVTDNAGKTATATATVTVNQRPTITLSNAAVCPGACATITAGGGVSYSWSAPFSGTASTQSACPAATSTYTVTGTDANGCTNTATATVTINPLPTVTVTNLTICKDTVGSITASGASAYTWSCGGTGATIKPSTAVIGVSTCTVTGTDANGCKNTAVSTIKVNDCSKPNVNLTDGIICIGNCYNLTAVGTGGVGTLTYAWSPNLGSGAGPFSVCPTSTSSYSVTVTDANGATASDVATVTVNPLPTIAATSATICNGSCATITASGAGSGTYVWAAPLGSGASQNICPTTTSTYSLTGTDANGCTNTATTTVTVNPIPVINVPNAGICPGGSTTLTATGANTYAWSPATGLSPTTGATVTASPAGTTTYTVIGTDAAGCSSSTTVTVTVGALVANAGPDVAICFGSSTQLNASGGTIYTWTPATGLSNSTISNPVATPTVTTTYTVTVSDGTCSDDDVVIVTVDPAISLNVAPVNVTCFGSCNGQTIVIPSGGNGSFTYSWSGGCTQAACSNVCAGTYTLTATDGVGCTATGSTTVTEPSALTVSAPVSTNVSCFGLCDGTASVTANGSTPPYSYSWSPSGGAAANATALCAGTYTCTVTDANSCSVKISVTITQPTQIVVTSAGASLCPGQCTTLNSNSSGGSAPYTFSWSPAPSTTTSVTDCPANTTVYSITTTDANGCTGGTSVTVTVNPAPVISIPPATICQGTSTTLNASGASTYSWSPTTGLSSGAGATLTANPFTTTTYTVVGTNSFGCTGSSTVTVTVNLAPVITTTGGNACPGLPITLTASGANTYTWAPPTFLNTTTGPTVISNPSGTTTYTITGVGANGCSATANATATVNPRPVAAFTTAPDDANEFNPTIYFYDQSTGGPIVTWHWTLGDSANTPSSLQNPVFKYPPLAHTYPIKLVVVNQYGCIDSITGTVIIHGIFTFYIPNTFTPNNDGINDGFMPKGVGIDETDYDLWIFDRWGNLIWHTSTWGDAWDGKANHGANVAQIDTYVWKVHVREKESGAKHNYIGHVNIIK